MPGLTDAERRGAFWLAALLALGVLHDVYRARHPAWAPAARESGGTLARADSAEAPPAVGPGSTTPEPTVDLNRAGIAELYRLPGIGPVLARRIVEHRVRHGAFRSVEELLGVPGIGPRLLERLRPHLRVPG